MMLLVTAVAMLAGAPVSAGPADRPILRAAGLVVVWGADGNGAGANAPIVSDFIINTGTGSTAATSGDADLVSGDVFTVVSGSLIPVGGAFSLGEGTPMIIRNPSTGPNFNTDTNGDGVMSGADAFAGFGLQNNTDTNTRRAEIISSFYVASNTAFSIDAQATALGTTTLAQMNRIRLRLRVTQNGDDGLPFGSAAQFPNSGGTAGGSQANNRRLSTLLTPRRVFAGNQRTARIRGTLAEQSVRFDLRYRYRSGNIDLSDGAFDAEAEVVYTVYVP